MVENRALTRGQKGAVSISQSQRLHWEMSLVSDWRAFHAPEELGDGKAGLGPAASTGLQPPTSRTRPPQHVLLEALPGDQVRSALTPSGTDWVRWGQNPLQPQRSLPLFD